MSCATVATDRCRLLGNLLRLFKVHSGRWAAKDYVVMKRTLIYALVLVALGVAVWFGVLQKKVGTRALAQNAFAYPDTANISKIFLADLGDKEILLERKSPGSWTVNGKFNARRDVIETLLSTLVQVETKYPVNKAQYDLAVREIAGNHTKVEIYNNKGVRAMTYYVGPPTVRNRGNFMKLEKSKDPYVVHIPGLDGFLQTRFIVKESDWRDRTIFRYIPPQVQELSLTYATNPDSSWTLKRTGENDFSLSSSLETSNRTLNVRATTTYLMHYRNIQAEAFMNDWAKRDSVLGSTPICTLSVKTMAGEVNNVYLFFRSINQRSKLQFDPFGNPLEFDRDKYYASLREGKDLALVQDFVFGKLFIGPSYFFQPEPEQRMP